MKIQSVPAAVLVMTLFLVLPATSKADTFDEYLANFSYQERKDMKIGSKELVELLKKGEAQLIDIRFPEEFAAWRMGFAKNIPLNELPSRLGELDKNKLIVTACPHYDRSSMARLYLITKGYRARYLNDGLLGLAELLRGDTARDFVNAPAQ
ncbi:MAG: rhodanese-like domain-containing protein [Desulfurivibrionaceae bacterium]|jgi:rhodanese-related sulfurtransferase|nr:rhodanese-like domain-containing protein [Pseudomonadota bacterium]MCG2823852.1 rhodanese-like domain-containing protein [Desulfobulbaceae bacterium]MDP2003346.1 rhodanese-like domain-containing protein [Desulfurivibrionaceae bacterium]PKN23602.1 MAG: rhodanese-like domain-containing protein [Deltaproteobacteria bacterium HGW-Deltaproteobacteria-3]MBU4407644.1 rhodanese-like domain-containing protein [Pseudomonadota bacterium]